MIVMDIEIKNAILGKGEKHHRGIEYRKGWTDYENMGVSIIGVYDCMEGRSRVFLEDNMDEFRALVEDDDNWPLCGFNNIAFDNAVLRHNGIDIPEEACYDILREIWIAAGLAPSFRYPTHRGFPLGSGEVSDALGDHRRTVRRHRRVRGTAR